MDDDFDRDMDTGRSGLDDEELSLPKATIAKVISELLPKNISCGKDTRDLFADCCVEFVHLLSSEANDICDREQKKTITGEHVVSALKALGFDEYVDEVTAVSIDHQKTAKDRERKSFKLEDTGKTEEELLAQQEQLFQAARLRFQQQQQQQQQQPGGEGSNATSATTDQSAGAS